MSFMAPYWYTKYHQTNDNYEFNKVVRQAKQALGETITSRNEIPFTTLNTISTTINNIDNYLKNKHGTSALIFLKAQLCHKSGKITQSTSCYMQIINKPYTTNDKAMLAKTNIGMANIMNQKAQAAKETKIEGEKHSTTNYDNEFKRYINNAIKLTSTKQIKNIMNQYNWPYEPQKKYADNILQTSQKNQHNLFSLIKF